MGKPVRAKAQVPSNEQMLQAFAEFLRIDVANGDAAADTVRGYHAQVTAWVRWCRARGIAPAAAGAAEVKAYRGALVEAGYKASSIAHKLTVLRRFYEAARSAGLRADNPAASVRPPRAKRAEEDLGFLSEGELELLQRSLPEGKDGKALRDRAMLGLMSLQGLRTVEIMRASVEDLREGGEALGLVVRGKGRDRLTYLRSDVAESLKAYLEARGTVAADELGTPLFVAVGNRSGGRRISRRGIRQVVDFYLRRAEVKRPGVSGHALRHTAGTLAYRYTRDLRAVQEMLGHSSPQITSRYAHIVDGAKNNPAFSVPVSWGKGR
jgi:site-specific recombinase XerD